VRFSKDSNAPIGREVEGILHRRPVVRIFSHSLKSWIWTVTPRDGFGVVMDDNCYDPVAELGTRIGMLMEDHCELALTMGSLTPELQGQAITKLEIALTHMITLLDAAKALRDQIGLS